MQLTREQLLILYKSLIRARKFDEAMIKALGEGRILAFYHSCQGHEAVGVGGCAFLREGDYVFAHLRGHGLPYLISRGGSPKGIYAEHCGKATGCCNGISGFHRFYPEIGMLGSAGTIGSAFPVSVGWALAAKKRGKGQVVLCFFGDGSSNRGTCHEAMNMAAVWRLPIVWICENNLIAQYVPVKDGSALENIADMASAYGMPGIIVDGMDVLAVHEAVQTAVARARKGDGPSLIECKVYRFRSHSEGRPDWWHSDIRPKEEIEKWQKRDPIKIFSDKLLADGILTNQNVKQINQEVMAEVEDAERFAAESPPPDPSILKNALYAES